MNLSPCLILPYDDSPLARATLAHAARALREERNGRAEIVLAVAGVDRDAAGRLAGRTRALAGPAVGLALHMLPPGDPIAGFKGLARAFPNAVLAAPVEGAGGAPWFHEACRFEGLAHPILLFAVDQHDLMVQPGDVPTPTVTDRGWRRALCGLRVASPWRRTVPGGASGD